VADWVCPGGTGAGYPTYAYACGPEYGYKNLAVFYHACTFDCLFCQNWHFRLRSLERPATSDEELVAAVDAATACICYFGGDPTPQLPHAIRVSKLARERNRGRILRICWETNGSMHRALLRAMADLSLESGGCIKFDLKAWDEGLHLALCGVSNRHTLANLAWLADYTRGRPQPPPLVVSTLLVPGYVDAEEVGHIARFIASLDPEMPYSLLAFYPQFLMKDLPTTSLAHAREALEAARAAGLRRVHIGNIHLLR
jgi:pyruvate formate lyase activating enzyme